MGAVTSGSNDAELVAFDVVHDDPEFVWLIYALRDAAAGFDESSGLSFDAVSGVPERVGLWLP
jgi:hypothetical protein